MTKTNTFFKDCKLKFNVMIFLVSKLFLDDFPAAKASCIINDYLEEKISLNSVRLFYSKLRLALRQNVFQKMRSLILQGPCEIDDVIIYKERPGYPFV